MHNAESANQQLRWAMANALTVVADRADRNAIKALIEVEGDDDVRTWLKRALKSAGGA